MSERAATCVCGKLGALCAGEPVRMSVCHCLDCKRRTGSAFSAQATYLETDVTLRGEASSFTRTSDDGYWATTSFCANCGSTVWYRIERRPGLVSVPIGGFEDASWFEPRFSVYEERKNAWVELCPDGPLERED